MRSKWLIGGLVASLVANLLLAGFIAGRMAMRSPPPAMAPDPTAGYGRLLGFLPAERRDAIKPMLRSHLREVIGDARSLRGEQKAVLVALAQEPFDAQALANALAELRSSLTATQEASHRSLVEIAATLTAAERRQLADAMRRPPWRHDGMHEGPRPHHP